jgi:hypothetical protein
MLAQLTSIEGMASDVRQARITVVSRDVPWRDSYECLLRISDRPVVLRVDGPIFIKDAETIVVIGTYNRDGVFEASAYYNRSSGVSGRSGRGLDKWRGIMLAGVGVGLASFYVLMRHLSGPDNDLVGPLLFSFNFILLGVVVVWGLVMFVQGRIRNRTIERLLNDA